MDDPPTGLTATGSALEDVRMVWTRLTTNRLVGRYSARLQVTGVPLVVLGGIVGRLPMSMLSIALPLVVVGQTGS